jgi:hypothetical protein
MEQTDRAFPELPWFSDAWTKLPLTPLGFPDFYGMWAYHKQQMAQ